MNQAHGQALVFLATSTNAFIKAPTPDATLTSPVVPAGVDISGTRCQLGNGTYEDCVTPTGTINYADGTPPQSYDLTVPDWVYGSNTLAALSLPHRNTTGAQQTRPTNIYAFAVPLKPGAGIDSVTLPDLSDSARVNVPGMHIFGMAVRDTTTAANGATWAGAWASPTEGRFQFRGTPGFQDQTIRTVLTPQLSGDQVRIRLSNVTGTDTLSISHVTIAQGNSGSAVTGAATDLTFNGGSKSLSLPWGAEAYSDPLPYTVSAAAPLAVSIHLANTVPYLVMNPKATTTRTYISAYGSGDHTAETADTAFSGTDVIIAHASDILTGLDVTSATPRPTVAVLGNGVVDGRKTGTTAGNTTPYIAPTLANRLRTESGGTPAYGIVDAGVENNLLDTDQVAGGRAAVSRLDRDVLALPGITTVIIEQGLQDAVAGDDDTTIETSLGILRDQLKGWGIKAIFTSLTPCSGYAPCTAAVEANRAQANTWISDQIDFIAPTVTTLDAEALLAEADPSSTTDPPAPRLRAAAAPNDYDSGDHINLTGDAYRAISDAIDTSTLGPDQ